MRRSHEPGSPTHLAWVRIVFGAHLALLFLSPVYGLLDRVRPSAHPLSQSWLSPLEPWVVDNIELIVSAGLISSLCMLVGLLTRVSVPLTLLCFLLSQNFWYRLTAFHDDWLYLTLPLIILSFAPSADAWSLDARLFRRAPARAPNAWRWPIEAMIACLALVYVCAGLAKLFPLAKGVAWLGGASTQSFAVEFARDSPLFWMLGSTPFDYTQHRWVFMLAAGATVIIELGAGLLWFTARYRWRFMIALALLSMHVGIWLMGIPGFVWIFAVHLVLFVPSEWFSDGRSAPAGETD